MGGVVLTNLTSRGDPLVLTRYSVPLAWYWWRVLLRTEIATKRFQGRFIGGALKPRREMEG